MINSSTRKPLSAASIKDTKAEGSRNIWAISRSKVALPRRQHSKNRKHPSSVVGWPLWTENWKLCQRCKKFASRLGEKPRKCHPVWPLLAVLSPGHVPPTFSVPETTRGVWLPGPSATTVTGSNTIGADRDMRAEEADSYVGRLGDCGSSRRRPRRPSRASMATRSFLANSRS